VKRWTGIHLWTNRWTPQAYRPAARSRTRPTNGCSFRAPRRRPWNRTSFAAAISSYAVARQFVHGVTVDSACGCGYGTHILSKNPDVTRAYGIDMNADAIEFAAREYSSDRVKFINAEIGTAKIGLADTLVSIETIEHLENPKVLNDFVEAHAVESLVVSFPIKKTTHYNKFHHWDFKTQDMGDIFFNFTIYKEFLFQYDTCFVCLERHNRPGRPEKRWRAPDLR
jgi:hypothetical protein